MPMAKFFIRPKKRHSLAAFFLYYFFIGLKVFAESNANKSPYENNDFDVFVKTINGKVYVTWNTSSLWQNTTVYFLSNLHDNVTNESYSVNISVCHAFKVSGTWKIEPVKGNLLEFCNRSRNCGPVYASDSIVQATGIHELSCKLFTTCNSTNFEDVFRIQVLSIDGGRKYSFQSGNMTILSENIPPLFEIQTTSDELPENAPITLTITSGSKLCGFGANPAENLQFVFKYYKVNDSKCFYLGQKTASYSGNVTTEVTFNDVIMRKTDNIYFDYTVKSLASKKTTSWQRLKFISSTATKCRMIGGVIYISWRPQWNCFDENIIEQAKFCFYKGQCLPVCEASFFANGTFREARTYDNISNVCGDSNPDCRIKSVPGSLKINNVSNKFINVSWSPDTQRITCALFRTCMDYTNPFSVVAYTLNDERQILDNVDICPRNTEPYHKNQPAVPHDVHAIDVQANQVTITWASPRCELNNLECNVRVIFNEEETEEVTFVGTDGLNNIYKFTKKNLPAYEYAKFQVYTKCAFDKNGEKSPLKKVMTKPSAPQYGPNLDNIESLSRTKIRLTWQYLEPLRGVPNETRIIGLVNNTVVFRETIYSGDRSATLTVNETQRCAYYQVKLCNAPNLCSDYSNRYNLPTCAIVPSTPYPESQTPSSNDLLILIIAVITIAIVLVAVLVITYCYCQKRRKIIRTKLPTLGGEKDQTTGDYIHMRRLSNLGEYHTLDKAEHLEQLAT